MKYFLSVLTLFIAVAATADSPVGPKLDGWLDLADCSGISGWAWDASQPDARLQVDLYDANMPGAPIATAAARHYRADLKRVGMGDGMHAFYLETPASLKDGRLHAIIATVSGAGAPIKLGQNTLSCPAEATGYQYFFSDSLSAANSANWIQRGDTPTSETGAALIARAPVPNDRNDYEVRAIVNLRESGGVYSIYLHASADALAGPSASGSYYAIELKNPTFTEKGCSATVQVSKRTSDTVTTLGSKTVACHNGDGVVLRGVYTADGRIGAWLDHKLVAMIQDSEIASGQPGIGVRGAPEANQIASVDLGLLDRLAPGPLLPADVRVSAAPESVKLEWPRLTDDPNGTGVGIYTISRDGKVIAEVSRAKPVFVDDKVSPNTSYTYEISAYDWHLNRTSTFVTVATPVKQ